MPWNSCKISATRIRKCSIYCLYSSNNRFRGMWRKSLVPSNFNNLEVWKQSKALNRNIYNNYKHICYMILPISTQMQHPAFHLQHFHYVVNCPSAHSLNSRHFIETEKAVLTKDTRRYKM